MVLQRESSIRTWFRRFCAAVGALALFLVATTAWSAFIDTVHGSPDSVADGEAQAWGRIGLVVLPLSPHWHSSPMLVRDDDLPRRARWDLLQQSPCSPDALCHVVS